MKRTKLQIKAYRRNFMLMYLLGAIKVVKLFRLWVRAYPLLFLIDKLSLDLTVLYNRIKDLKEYKDYFSSE